MAKRKFKFAEGAERKQGCQEFVNVLGSAAILEDDVVYGVGAKHGIVLTGRDLVKVCPRWSFETTKPPAAVAVKEATIGKDRKWLRYMGEGDWVAAIESLLARKSGPGLGDQSRIRAWNLAIAVSRFDAQNPRLAPLGPKFVEACHKLLGGEAKADCLESIKVLFPDA